MNDKIKNKIKNIYKNQPKEEILQEIQLKKEYTRKTLLDKKGTKTKKQKKFEEKANKLGYTLISPYKGYLKDITLLCNKGHVFQIKARNIDRNKGCPVCSGYRTSTTREIKEICLNINIKLIEEYKPGQRFKIECLKCGKQIKLRRADIKKYKCKCEK